jgi:hypothetical protein
MPLYEYVAREDGTVIELLRPMSQADQPVADPEGKGRTFTRKHSTFAAASVSGESRGEGRSLPVGGCCPCGKSAGQCGRG